MDESEGRKEPTNGLTINLDMQVQKEMTNTTNLNKKNRFGFSESMRYPLVN